MISLVVPWVAKGPLYHPVFGSLKVSHDVSLEVLVSPPPLVVFRSPGLWFVGSICPLGLIWVCGLFGLWIQIRILSFSRISRAFVLAFLYVEFCTSAKIMSFCNRSHSSLTVSPDLCRWRVVCYYGYPTFYFLSLFLFLLQEDEDGWWVCSDLICS